MTIGAASPFLVYFFILSLVLGKGKAISCYLENVCDIV